MRRSPVEYKGNFVIESTTGDIYAADRLKVTEKGTNIYLGAIQTGTVNPEEISAVHQLEKGQSLDLSLEKSKIAASFLILEKLIEDYTKAKGLNPSSFSSHHGFCIFGACSLALTILPERTSEDIDLTAPEDFVDFINEANAPYTELSIEVLPPTINQLLGNWQERTTKMLGYKGTEFLVLHPLDTIAQKLLRLSEEKFEIKDKPDIKAILTRLGTPENSLKSILTENALRYYPNPLGKDEQNIAVERNTRWFCKTFLTCNYEELVKEAIDRLHNATARIGHGDKIPSLPSFKLDDKIKLHKKSPDDFQIL